MYRRLSFAAAGSAAGGATCALVCYVQARLAARGPQAPHPAAPTTPTLPAADGLRIVWYGDSLAVGVGVSDHADTPAAQVHRLLGSGHHTIAAIPGTTVAGVAAQIAAADAHGPYDLAVLSVGANDVAAITPLPTFMWRYRAVLDAIEGPVVCCGMPDIAAADRIPQPLRTIAGWRGRILDRIIRREAHRRGHLWIDLSSRPEGITRRAGRALLSVDRFHPGPAVYALWAERIAAGALLLTTASVGANV